MLVLPPHPLHSIVKVVSMHRADFHNYIRPERLNNELNSSYCWIKDSRRQLGQELC